MNKNILKIFSGVIFLILISKGLGFIRESFIAARYGAGYISDVYVFEDGLINALYTVWAGVISTTYVPMSLSMDSKKQNKFSSNFLNIFILIVLFICVFIIAFTNLLLHLLVPGFFTLYDSKVIAELILITRVNALSLLLVFLENYFIVFLQSKKIYIFSSIQGIILNASLILYLLFFYKYGIWGIVITKIVAHLFNVIVLIVFVQNRKLFNYSFYINFKEAYVKEIIRLASPVFILNLISQLNYIVDRSMASSLDSGSMALLNYANVIASLLYSVLGTSLTTMAYTEMSTCQNNTEKLQNEFSKFLELLVDIITPACIVMIVMRENIVSVFYGRGQISGESLQVIMLVVILYVPSNYLMSLRDLMNRLMYINKKTTIPSIITGVTFGLNIFLNLVLVKYIGVYGLALATSISSFVATIVSYIYIKHSGFVTKKVSLKKVKFIYLILAMCACVLAKDCIRGNIVLKIISIIIGGGLTLTIFNLDLIISKLNGSGE